MKLIFQTGTRLSLSILWIALFANSVHAEDADTLQVQQKTIHRLEWDVVPSTILHTNPYLKGANDERRTMNHAFTTRLKYAFQMPQTSVQAQTYKDAYQGIGVAYHNLNPQLGNPLSAFIFQGAPIKRFTSSLSLNYEWNLGLAFNWHPYNQETNPQNKVIGSKVTAYIDADFYLRWRLSNHLDLNAGISLSHYSNGNTSIPNAGLNIIGGRVSLAYYLNRENDKLIPKRAIPPFNKHISYDLLVYGAWRKQGIYLDGNPVALPDRYGVIGFNFTPLYNLNHWFNAGISLDGVYDSSSNLYIEDYLVPSGGAHNDLDHVVSPSAIRQMSLGLSARAEFVMPYFTIDAGIGKNIINAHAELKGWYQTLALKVDVAHSVFLNIGYSLYDFKTPNHLMLGIGYHFHHKRGH